MFFVSDGWGRLFHKFFHLQTDFLKIHNRSDERDLSKMKALKNNFSSIFCLFCFVFVRTQFYFTVPQKRAGGLSKHRRSLFEAVAAIQNKFWARGLIMREEQNYIVHLFSIASCSPTLQIFAGRTCMFISQMKTT